MAFRISDRVDKSWQVPPFTATGGERMAWVNDVVDWSESWLRGQTAYQDIPAAMSLIAGRKLDDNTDEDLNTNYAKYAIRKIVAALSEVREIGQYQSEAKFYKPQVAFMNKAVRAVYLESLFSRQMRVGLQYMAATASGYLWPKAKRGNYGMDKEIKIVFEALGLLDVLPFQMPANNCIQDAYAVTVLECVPVAEAHARYPAFQGSLLPIARRRYDSQVSNRRMDLWERFRYGSQTGEGFDKFYCELRHTFIHDLSVNTTGMVLPMGDKGSSWYYEVPYVGMMIPDGVSRGGGVRMRKATIDDCRIYPQLRMITTSRGMRMPMHDGPGPDWHGTIPPVRICADDWPWEPMGYALTHDINTPERSRQNIERMVLKVLKARLAPALGYDRSAGVGDQTGGTIDLYDTDLRLGVDGDPEKVVRALLPADLRNVPQEAFKMLEYLISGENQVLGLADIMNFAKLKMNIQSSESLDKLLEFDGPLVKDIAFGIESAVSVIANQMRFMIPQWMTVKRLMQYVGEDGITPETLDFDPESLVPSHGPDEMTEQDGNIVVPENSIYTKMQRARMFANNIRLISVPHTQHEFTQVQEQLKWLQIGRSGFPPVAPHDVAKKLNIENYGEIEGATYFDRWENWEKKKLELMAQAQQLASSLMPQPPGGGGQEQGQGPKGGQKGTGGRAPSGQAPPKVKQKGQSTFNPRTTVSESK